LIPAVQLGGGVMGILEASTREKVIDDRGPVVLAVV
jgi:hypothetical protein